MRTALSHIPARWFEVCGTAAAGLAWVAIGAQISHELAATGPSQLAYANVVGFLLNFAFWTLYGLRFDRPAVWIGNLVAVSLQLVLLVLMWHKGASP
jgi:hypothetical protein